jgi:hypothetical protein
MTDRHHAGEDTDVPGLEDVLDDADPDDPETADELLEGLLGADVSERDDIPDSGADAPDEGPSADPDAGADEQTATGRRVCRFCENERRSPDGATLHHATCPDSRYYREIHWSDDADTDDPDDVDAEGDVSQPDPGGDTPGEQRTFLVDTQ